MIRTTYHITNYEISAQGPRLREYLHCDKRFRVHVFRLIGLIAPQVEVGSKAACAELWIDAATFVASDYSFLPDGKLPLDFLHFGLADWLRKWRPLPAPAHPRPGLQAPDMDNMLASIAVWRL